MLPIDSRAKMHAVPGAVHPVFAAGSQASEHKVTGSTPPIPSEMWREQRVPFAQSLSPWQKAAQVWTIVAPLVIATQADPATQPCVEQSSPGCAVPTRAQ
jgi:hypothetical protein